MHLEQNIPKPSYVLGTYNSEKVCPSPHKKHI